MARALSFSMQKPNKVKLEIEIGKDIKPLLDHRKLKGQELNTFIETSVTYYHGKLLKGTEKKTRPVRMGRL